MPDFRGYCLDKNREIKKLEIEILRCDANVGEYELKIEHFHDEIKRVEYNIDLQRKRKQELFERIEEIRKTEGDKK